MNAVRNNTRSAAVTQPPVLMTDAELTLVQTDSGFSRCYCCLDDVKYSFFLVQMFVHPYKWTLKKNYNLRHNNPNDGLSLFIHHVTEKPRISNSRFLPCEFLCVNLLTCARLWHRRLLPSRLTRQVRQSARPKKKPKEFNIKNTKKNLFHAVFKTSEIRSEVEFRKMEKERYIFIYFFSCCSPDRGEMQTEYCVFVAKTKPNSQPDQTLNSSRAELSSETWTRSAKPQHFPFSVLAS